MSGPPGRTDGRIPVCYLAPWVDYGGSDKGTIDLLRWLDRDRFAPILVTAQPSDNRRLLECEPYAEEIWPLPELLGGQHFPGFIFDLIFTRGIEILHIMNARIGYDLLPDLASLPHPPSVVVQLHVEEPDRSGYVRYVTTRYGNLVDAFSVSSEHLARAVEGYDINPSKVHVIPTGVDGEGEFNPAMVRPTDAVDANTFNVLVPGRLTEQKNPLLMVDVIRRVIDSGRQLHVHVVGDGPLEPAVRRRVQDEGLARHFSFHPPSAELARWYSACDLLLMTSTFEGVPYVIYEAMAMELPVVAPALAGNAELMADTAGILVDEQDDPAPYAHAVLSLLDDRARAQSLAHAGRHRVLESFSTQSMGQMHSDLYSQLVAVRRTRQAAADESLPQPSTSPAVPLREKGFESRPPLRLFQRRLREQPLVSVVVPCFNHGRFLTQCVDSALNQDYENVEVVVVDDASTDSSTIAVFETLEMRERVRVIRLQENLGPSAARNRGIRVSNGRYVLPLDSDNLLLPGAVANLVSQLQEAGERVGYIYPNCQYFGTRDDYFQPPSFNLALLLDGNYCDTCSLIDREVFDAGLFYPEDIGLGHEDWDFVLTLAEHGVRGEPARLPTLLYRKHGFTRSDAVEYAGRPFHEEVAKRHPALFGRGGASGRFGRWRGPASEIEAGYAPALSLVMSTSVDFSTHVGTDLLRRLQEQSCRDFELIVECPCPPAGVHLDRIRRIPPGLCTGQLEVVREGLHLARADHVLLGGPQLHDMLADRGFVEKLQRTFWALPALDAIAFTDAGANGRFGYRLLEGASVTGPAHSLAWSAQAPRKIASPLLVDEASPAESIARAMSVHGVELQWRHAASPHSTPAAVTMSSLWIDLQERAEEPGPHARVERRMLIGRPTGIPATPWDQVRRWLGSDSWIPPETRLLTRQREAAGERRLVKLGRESPPGYVLEYDLGAIQRFAPPGTVRLVQRDGEIRTLPRGSRRDEHDDELGHLELAPLPLFRAVHRAVLPDGSETIVSGERDALRPLATQLDFLGFIEAFPNDPASPPDARRPLHGIVGLLRCLDTEARRHVYRVGSTCRENEKLVSELGALHLTAEPGSIAVLMDAQGRVRTQGHVSDEVRAGPRELLRWAVAPIGWRGFGHVRGRLRSSARRLLEASERARAPSGTAARSAEESLVGYLYRDPAPGRLELFAAVHRLTGDQLLTLYAMEAADMGYGDAVSLGFVLEQAPVTGSLEPARVSVPWASRFGLEVRRG